MDSAPFMRGFSPPPTLPRARRTPQLPSQPIPSQPARSSDPPPPSRPHCDARLAGRMISKTQAARRTANGTRRDRTPARAHTPSVVGRPRPLPSTRVRAVRSSVSPSKCKLRCSTATSAAMNGLTSRWSVRLSTKSLAPPRCAGQSSALCCSLRLSQCHLHNATHRADTLAE